MDWLLIETAPFWVFERNEAMLGQRNSEGRWAKVSLWNPARNRDAVQLRGATHWFRIAAPPPDEGEAE